MCQPVTFLISYPRATYTFSLLPMVFQMVLFPVGQMMAVISRNEMTREPILCREEGQSLALCEKQCYGLGQTEEAKVLLGQLQQRLAWILIECPHLHLRLITF